MNVDGIPASSDSAVARASLRAVRVPLALKGAYAVGAALDLMVNSAISIFLLFYATSVCGLSAALAGGALAVGLVVDAVADPLIGSLSDNHHSRWGRRLPFMVAGTPVLLVSFVTLFSLPEVRGQLPLFLLLSTACIAVRVSLSVFNLPYTAVGAEISDDENERARIIATRWAAGMVAGLFTVALGFSVFFKGAGGVSQRAAYTPFAATLAAVMLGCALLAMLAVRRTLARQHLPPTSGQVPVAHLLPELRELFQSHTFRVLFAVAILFSAAQGVTQSLGLHSATFFWRLTSEQMQASAVAFPIGLILGAPLAGPVIARMELRTAALMGLSGLIATQAVPTALRLAGALPLEGQPLVLTLAGSALLGGAMTSIAAIALLSMMTDAADEHEFRFGARREGLYFASWSFASKAASGLGTFLSGLALSAIDFPIDQTSKDGVNTVLPAHMSNALGFCSGPGAAVLSVLAVLILLGYRLNRKTHASMMSELGTRRART